METYDRLNALGLTDPQIRTENGGLHARPAWIDNETFLVEERSQDRKPRILSVNTATSRVRTFLRTERLAGLAAMPGSSSVVFSQIAEDDPYSDTYDLFVYNTETGRKRRLTKGERLRDPAPFPDGGSVVAVAQEYSKTWLARVWLEDGRVEPLMNPDAFGFDAQFSEPSVSPDGKSIAVSIWHDDGNRDIFLYALDERRFHRLTADPGQDQDPNYSADGRTLYFVSDRTGVSNVYALNLASRELTQVTNVLTGAFWPTPNPDETSLAFIHYAARGYDAATLPLARSFGKHFPPETIAENAVVTGPVTAAMNKKSGELAAEERKYSAWPTILPSYWNPVYSTSVIQGEQVSALGIQTSGYDSVYRHAWSLLVTHRFDRGFTGGAVSYAYNRFKPALRVSASRVGLDYGNIAEDPTGNTHAFFLKRNAFAGGASWPVTDHLSFFGNFVAQRFIADTTVDAPRNHLPEDGWFMGPRVGAVFVNTESYAMSIAPENGGAYVLSAAFDNSAFGSDYDMAVGLASAEQWISLPWYNNVLDLQLKGAFAQGDDLYRTPVRVGGFVQEDLTAQTSTNSFALRGYESGALLGERAVVGSADYRTPIWYQQRGLGTWPIFFDTLSASIFADAAKVWSGELDLEDPGRIWESYGLELYQSLGVGYYFGFTLRYAFAFTPGFDDPDSHFIAAGALF
ncbi:MAG: hypothetical protein M5R36_21575 [Deltaproteobacteria bacterium]|nr:hypothetical protein [Deltaproteobacteria bacterium]